MGGLSEEAPLRIGLDFFSMYVNDCMYYYLLYNNKYCCQTLRINRSNKKLILYTFISFQNKMQKGRRGNPCALNFF